MTNSADPRVLDTLALAHAAAGHRERAAQTTRAALAIAERTGDERLAARLRARLSPAVPGSDSGTEVEGLGPGQRFVPDP